MTVWELEVYLVDSSRDAAHQERLKEALPAIKAFGHETSAGEVFLVIDQEASNRSEAIATLTATVEAELGADAISRVVGGNDATQNREVLLWIRGTRRQVRRWEIKVASNLLANFERKPPKDYEIWDAQIEKHLALVSANNLRRAICNADGRFTAMPRAMARDIRNQRDLHEHWDEQRPVFYNVSEPGPLRRAGAEFVKAHPGGFPYRFLSWNSDEGPRLGPGLLVAELNTYLDAVEAEVLAVAPDLERFVSAVEASPWVGGNKASDRWWPVKDRGD